MAANVAITMTLMGDIAQAGEQVADCMFVNGRVITLDAQCTAAQALTAKNGHILAVGSAAEIRRFAGEATQVDDLGSKVMVTEFYAAHDHVPSGGVATLFGVNLNSLSRCTQGHSKQRRIYLRPDGGYILALIGAL